MRLGLFLIGFHKTGKPEKHLSRYEAAFDVPRSLRKISPIFFAESMICGSTRQLSIAAVSVSGVALCAGIGSGPAAWFFTIWPQKS